MWAEVKGYHANIMNLPLCYLPTFNQKDCEPMLQGYLTNKRLEPMQPVGNPGGLSLKHSLVHTKQATHCGALKAAR